MCIISISEIGTALPDAATRKIMWENNPDGAGFMYARNGKVHIRKGFMTYQEFETAIENLDFDPKDVQFLMHFRIGTHGGNTPANTHPFPVTARVKPMQELKYECDVAFMHNGIINSVEMCKKSISDTMEYNRQILADLYKLDNEFYKRASLQILIEESINGSRMVFLTGKGEVVTLGNWVEGEDGCLYSNTTYKDWRKKFQSKWDKYDKYDKWGGYTAYPYYKDNYGDYADDYKDDYKFEGKDYGFLDNSNSNILDDGSEYVQMELYEPPKDAMIMVAGELMDVDNADIMCDESGDVYIYDQDIGAFVPDDECSIYTVNGNMWKPDPEYDSFDVVDVMF